MSAVLVTCSAGDDGAIVMPGLIGHPVDNPRRSRTQDPGSREKGPGGLAVVGLVGARLLRSQLERPIPVLCCESIASISVQ